MPCRGEKGPNLFYSDQAGLDEATLVRCHPTLAANRCAASTWKRTDMEDFNKLELEASVSYWWGVDAVAGVNEACQRLAKCVVA